ncbi:protein of unknown function (DUF1992) [Streptoalloteichus tenebrarius]|uniref:DnaJ homologue subfamily C member 28 conserved domain-containing protein n=1 Tax=Streptoalloteichus tenebrarius (strain ATCC 17920 / DSM 40477 / JCM 4838 / CBS 697.72 / NBRC 16177 / NCIMB 11028 / NRRL B-12390 / A12253. 1 / ISP 5477) TaxID=1933 RepID=A0ABT1HPN6_STRSD|nr:DUF1992 domain-containing protein [Streptoalloteichus tenebrarius]MCP2257435.1 protein of unknown function (DUF1992) [Streptoalloteichus tenebrarius]BFE98380.1 DUF1992 domain-containing protein [Streptoalloteichus tenebrarius]
MTERKPSGMSFESWVERQIREATERGELDNLPGSGRPLPDANQPYDELWWVKKKVRQEGLPIDPLLPLPLRLRKEVERLPETLRDLSSEEAVRDTVRDLNERILAWLRSPTGPRVPLAPVNVEAAVRQWHDDRAARTPRPEVEPAVERQPTDEAPPPRRRSWWHRITRRNRNDD